MTSHRLRFAAPPVGARGALLQLLAMALYAWPDAIVEPRMARCDPLQGGRARS